MKRRSFIQNVAYTGALSPLAGGMMKLFEKPEYEYLTILHTNDVHSRIEPFPLDDARYAGQGGIARRANLIKDVREDREHVLLLDSGDIFQGTPYFNYFGGELEFKLMDKLQYDVATIGNHDFDAGVEVLAERCEKANFTMVNSNYNLSDSLLKNVVKPYKIIEKGDIKIGVFGVGIELDGLVPTDLYGNIKYQSPYEKAEEIAIYLKKKEKCDVVICLSHLGYTYESGVFRPCDTDMAEKTSHIDVILGGHTHTFLKHADLRTNKLGEQVIVNQVGWAGLMLGRIDLMLEKNRKNKCVSCKNLYLQESIDNTIIKHN